MAEPRTSNALILAEVRSLGRQLDVNTRDTREARDISRDVQASLPGVVGEIVRNAVAEAARTSDDKLEDVRENIAAHGRRLEVHSRAISDLQTAKARAEGAQGFLGSILRYLPPSLAGAAAAVGAVAAWLGLQRPH